MWSLRRFNSWQTYLKTCVPWLRGDMQVAVMPIYNNSICDIQAQTSAFANTFRGEKWLEDMLLHRLWNTRPVVRDLHYNTFMLVACTYPDMLLPYHVLHRVTRVIQQVGPDLIEFTAIRIYMR